MYAASPVVTVPMTGQQATEMASNSSLCVVCCLKQMQCSPRYKIEFILAGQRLIPHIITAFVRHQSYSFS